MISPLGTTITLFDSGLSSSVDSLTGLVSGTVPGPLAVGVVILFAVQGVKVANGDSGPLRDLVPLLVRFALVFWLITNPTVYLYYVRDVLFTSFPSAVISAATGTGGSAMTTPAGVGTVLDSLWAQVWDASALVSQTKADGIGLVQAVEAFFMAVAAGGGLWLCAMVYMACRFFLTLVVIIGPVLIACWPFSGLRHYALSWKGVGVSLILAEVMTFVTMQVALLSCQPLMAKVTEALITTLTQPAAAADALQGLAAMGLILWTAASAISAVPLVTFYIGRGGSAPQPLIVNARS